MIPSATNTTVTRTHSLMPILNQKLDLCQFARDPSAAKAPQVIEISLTDGFLRIWVSQVEQLACEVERIERSSTWLAEVLMQGKQPGLPLSLAQSTNPFLRKMADTIAGELSYLEEPLAVYEVDTHALSGQLRSPPISQADDSRHYFEVTVGATGISLQRYAAKPQLGRKPIPATFTRGLLARICGDFERWGSSPTRC